MTEKKKHEYDMIIVGAGIAGLWLANRLHRFGYNILVVEKDKIGAGQTLASQGMIHGGQKYTLQGKVTDHAHSISAMPARWEECFDGYGEIDLTGVEFLSDHQIMWPAGSILSEAAVFGAAQLVNADTVKLKPDAFPFVLADQKKFKGPVYQLPEKVLNTKTLMAALSAKIKDRIVVGDVTAVLPDGQIAISGMGCQAQVIIFTAGLGNEDAFGMLKVENKPTQQRPLRQIMVKSLDDPLYGHGIVGNPKPRVTVTSHADGQGGFVWYLGGNVAEKSADMSEEDALSFAKAEMMDIFPDIDWADKEWATWYGVRAEPLLPSSDLPPGPYIHQRGHVLIAWPTKLTFAPALSDHIFKWVEERDIIPTFKSDPPKDLPKAEIADFPWANAKWQAVA